MGKDYTFCVGTVGSGLFRSPDEGETWNRVTAPMPVEGNVRALAVYPDNPHRILAGSDNGIYRSENNGATWEMLDSPMDGTQIWSIGVDPVDPDTIFAGTRPDAFRSKDGGKHWDKLSLGVTIPCPIGIPRTTRIIVDPSDHRTVWAGIEVDGVYKSLDGGDTWVHLPPLGPDLFHGDIHDMALGVGQPRAIYASGPYGIATSTDEGESWDYHEFPKYNESDKFCYCRGMLVKADDPNVIFVGNGDGMGRATGDIQLTRDGGETWGTAALPIEPNSRMWWFANNPSIPNVIAAASVYGYLYVSDDGGESWQKLEREFGEIRTLALMPN